ncbi:MAG: glycoside hydrolase family 3 N-terminal domain-containing protein, partial [Candidatus Izemoplasmatales bacterium]|nr:glycoside hydrolase family 3 N-terminal domain-containing protein [Candidatus Izemoplasmatales bacterium]
MFEDLLKTMSLEEKAKMMTGKDFWHLFELEQAKLPSIMVCDGPHGLRKQPNDSDPLGLGNSVPATCFPPACTSASSWDKELLKGIGKRIGEECVAEQVAVVLGPGANIKRSPLCGRNFEYFSEDPLLSGKMASSFIQGVQSQGVGTSLKHFVANNQEANRLVVDAIIDERTFREIYLKSFEIPVREALPWTVMCSYNKVNGEYMSENNKVLNEILRKEWGFDGLVMTDWGAANDRAKGIASGLDLEMPGNPNSAARLVKAVKEGRLKESELDLALSRILALIQKGAKAQTICKPYDQEEHHQFARLVAAESTVLLKNDGVLPFSKEKSLAIIGAFAKHPRYQGNGSSLIRPTKLVSAFDAFHEILGDLLFYAEGYPLGLDVVQPELISQALEMAKKADQVLVMVGLTESFESEGYDREHLSLPISQIALIASLLRERKDIVLAISNG